MGDKFAIALQVSNANRITDTNLYDWSVALTLTYQPGGDEPETGMATMTAQVVVEDESVYGPGWRIQGVDSLVQVTSGTYHSSGILFVTGTGDSRFFTGEGPSYTSPDEDQGSLQQTTGGYEYIAKDRTTLNFDSAGRLTSVIDPHNLARTYTYDTGGRLTGVAIYDGGLTTLVYDTNNYLQTVQEPGGRMVTITARDTRQNPTSVQDETGMSRGLGYDACICKLTGDQWNPLNASFSFDLQNEALSKIDRRLGSAYQTKAAAVRPLQTDPMIYLEEVRASVQDGLLHKSTYKLDDRDRILERIRPDNSVERWTRNDAGSVTGHTDFRGLTTGYQYGDKEDLIKVDYPDQTSIAYQYEQTFHRVTQATDELGRITQYQYNTTGDLVTLTNALSQTTVYTYNPPGLVESTTDEAGHWCGSTTPAWPRSTTPTYTKATETTFMIHTLEIRISIAMRSSGRRRQAPQRPTQDKRRS